MGTESIVFGPWIGEFGWEIARWIPACRFIARGHKGKKYAIGPRSHGILYEFVDEYIPLDKSFKYIPWMFTAKSYNKRQFNAYKSKASSLGRVISPDIIRPKKDFKMLGKKFQGSLHWRIRDITDRPIMCVFPRQRAHDAYRNWPISKWVQTIKFFCDAGFAVMSFGGPEDKRLDYENDNYFDFIEYDKDDELDLCVSALNLAEIGVTIQSGGFYVSLFSCKNTLIFGIERYVKRVKEENILNANYEYIVCKDFQFNPKHVIRHVQRSLKGRRSRGSG